MPSSDYYFFTDTNQAPASTYIEAQDALGVVVDAAAGACGPIAKVNSTDPDEYRVTSLHSATFDPTAYAACDAIVCVQRVPSTTTTPPLVNIILKPLAQPALNFAPIKYIIYKGILERSLIATNGTDVAALGNNDLTKFLWGEQAKKNASVTPNATASAPAKALGIDLTGTNFADTDPIDNLFYRAGVAFQLAMVKGGWSIGQFNKTTFGMEVLMDGLAFHHPLGLARRIEHKISVPALTGSENAAEKVDHWHRKEEILGFMDPCAFYGSFFLAGVLAKTSGNVPFAKKAGNTLYHDVLFPFANRNKAYLDIRNEHNFSLNYFKNYEKTTGTGSTAVTTTKIKIRTTEIDYYVNKWPLLTLTASNFASNTTTVRNPFALQLPVGDNPKPLVYVSQGYRDSEKGSFPAELTNAQQFFAAFATPVGGYTVATKASGPKSLVFVVTNIKGLGATTPVSCHIKLKYFKQQQGTPTVSTVIQSANYLDNLFYPLDLSILLEGAAGTKIKSAVYDEEIYVNAQDEGGLAFDFVGKVGIARDSNNTSFFLMPTNVRTQAEPASSFVRLTGETSDYPGSYPEFIALEHPLEKVRKSELVFSGQSPLPVAEFISTGDAAAQTRFDIPDFNKFFIFTVANTTFDTWKNKVIAAQASGFRTYLGVKNLQALTDDKQVQYKSFELALRSYVLDAANGQYNVQEIATDPASTTANITVNASC